MKLHRFEMQVNDALLEAVDQWRSRQPERVSRAEAFRRLFWLALDLDEKPRSRIAPNVF